MGRRCEDQKGTPAEAQCLIFHVCAYHAMLLMQMVDLCSAATMLTYVLFQNQTLVLLLCSASLDLCWKVGLRAWALGLDYLRGKALYLFDGNNETYARLRSSHERTFGSARPAYIAVSGGVLLGKVAFRIHVNREKVHRLKIYRAAYVGPRRSIDQRPVGLYRLSYQSSQWVEMRDLISLCCQL